jgi:hypothetical protein
MTLSSTSTERDNMNMMNEQHIFDLAAEHEANRNGLYGPVTFDSTGLVEFARAIEAEVASRYLASTAVEQAEPVKLDDIEQYRMQMAGISTAALGYWKESDSIHPDYDTVPLRDVAKLYAKYEALAQAAPASPVQSIHCRDRHGTRVELQILHAGPGAHGVEITVAAPAAPEQVQATGKLHELKTDPAVFAAVLAATSAAAPAAPEQDLDRLRRSQPAAHIATDLDGHGDVGMTIEQAKYRAGENCDTIIALHDISVDFVEHEGRPQVRDEVRNQALEEVAKLIDKKVESYCNEHGSYDHTTGVTEYPGDGAEWVCEMEELAEEIRAMKTATNEGDA